MVRPSCVNRLILGFTLSVAAGIGIAGAQSPGAASSDTSSPRSEPSPLVTLIPEVPEGRTTLDLFVREITAGDRLARTLRVVRQGAGGTLEQPGLLDLPREGRVVPVEQFDWLVPAERQLEIRLPDGFLPWLELAPETHAVLVDDRRLELVAGRIDWRAVESAGGEVTAGDLAVRGRGRGTITRVSDTVTVGAASGRLELWRGESLVAIVLAGQERSALVGADWASAGPDSLERRWDHRLESLYRALDRALVAIFTGPPGGDLLAEVWQAWVRFAPLYAEAESQAVVWVTAPHLVRREMAEGLRLLAAYRFEVPPLQGL